MTEAVEEKQAVKKGRKPNPPKKSIGNAFLLLRVYINDHEHLQDEDVGDRELKTAKARAIELYTLNKDWARIEAIAQAWDGQERVLFSMGFHDAFPFFILLRDPVTDKELPRLHYSKRQDAQAAYKEYDKQQGGVSLTNAFDRKVKSN